MLTHEERLELKRLVSVAKKNRISTFEGVCLECLEPIPPERMEFGAKYCTDTHRKRAADRKSKAPGTPGMEAKLARERAKRAAERRKRIDSYVLTPKRKENAQNAKRRMVPPKPGSNQS